MKKKKGTGFKKIFAYLYLAYWGKWRRGKYHSIPALEHRHVIASLQAKSMNMFAHEMKTQWRYQNQGMCFGTECLS